MIAQSSLTLVGHCRYDKCRGPPPGGARLSHAVSTRVPAGAVRDNARELEEGRDGTSDVRDTAMEAGGVLHSLRQRVQRRLHREIGMTSGGSDRSCAFNVHCCHHRPVDTSTVCAFGVESSSLVATRHAAE